MADGTLKSLVDGLIRSSNKAGVSADHLWYEIRLALNPGLLVANLSEALRISASETEALLIANGFEDVVAQKKELAARRTEPGDGGVDYCLGGTGQMASPFPELFSIEFSPPLNQPVAVSEDLRDTMRMKVDALPGSIGTDPFAALYRDRVLEYYDKFMLHDARAIDAYLANCFPNGYPRYIVNSGIGANEQFSHFLAHINNANPNARSKWLVIDSPGKLSTRLPADASVENTLFMEFSRSGKTEETLKIHEYTKRAPHRIVFANQGPLREIGLRDKNLVLELPDQVSGRFGRNKTPFLLAPMYVAGMDTRRFWRVIDSAVRQFDLSQPNNVPLVMAAFIRLFQRKNSINHIYFGCNDDILAFSADEFLQFWMEGVNKGGNDISMSRYLGLPRDSHATIEGILANHSSKMGIFLLRGQMRPLVLPPMTSEHIDPINPDHAGLHFGDEEIIMAEANYQRFSELMPTVKITVNGDLSIEHAAVLGQLWADITFCYSKLANVDPGSNPEVKFVRDRSERLLARMPSS